MLTATDHIILHALSSLFNLLKKNALSCNLIPCTIILENAVIVSQITLLVKNLFSLFNICAALAITLD